MTYKPLDLPFSEHRKIRKLPGVKAECEKIARELAAKAGALAGDPDGYEVEVSDDKDRVRVHVRAESGKAIRAEAKTAPLMQLSAEQGPRL
ncbi:hypothetical protein SEA_AMGINE_14 [Mycobacterium phage Amgine]|uniref:Head-to-tail connector protein n=1 Tax=Mycobacterium phage Amgine TaxID=2015817 RepID=A0A222ZMH9_9CAUD|nr:neck protein [Mycobacterium phage Amgine]ASR85615.1 hypothetical protein SEA_AMGINE_14 [Mycobacterium phage Amgine]